MHHPAGMGNGDFQLGSKTGGTAQQIRMFLVGVVETVASPFSLFNEVFVLVKMGRRFFSVLGVLASYYLIQVVWWVASSVGYLWVHRSSMKPRLVIDPMGLQQPQTENAVVEVAALPPDTMFLALKVFFCVAMIQKLLCFRRKILGCEADKTTDPGHSIFGFLLKYVPESWVERFAVNKSDFVLRYINPPACYFVGWIVAPLDALTGSLIQWSAIAMFARQYCVRLRFQAELDDIDDTTKHVSHIFEKRDETRDDNTAPILVRI